MPESQTSTGTSADFIREIWDRSVTEARQSQFQNWQRLADQQRRIDEQARALAEQARQQREGMLRFRPVDLSGLQLRPGDIINVPNAEALRPVQFDEPAGDASELAPEFVRRLLAPAGFFESVPHETATEKALADAELGVISKELAEAYLRAVSKALEMQIDAMNYGKVLERLACLKCEAGWVKIAEGEFELCECAYPESEAVPA